tara:strand:- start:407 stop:1003 length:597 start_codon:yes stop_codon:yes gene_type:complete
MKSQTHVFGRMVKRYDLPLDAIEDLNNRYEARKKELASFGPRLAGRIETEREFTHILSETKISKNIVDCMNDYIETCEKYGLYNGNKKLQILSCWINDMKEGEYNPPHTHNDRTGWSTVLFLKIPKFVDDTKDPHKFKDGKLCFMYPDGAACEWMEPEVGHFYIFEACHSHCVMPFKTKIKGDIRRSMSFNFVEQIGK